MAGYTPYDPSQQYSSAQTPANPPRDKSDGGPGTLSDVAPPSTYDPAADIWARQKRGEITYQRAQELANQLPPVQSYTPEGPISRDQAIDYQTKHGKLTYQKAQEAYGDPNAPLADDSVLNAPPPRQPLDLSAEKKAAEHQANVDQGVEEIGGRPATSTRSSYSASYSGPGPFEGQIAQDYNEQLAGMQEELGARQKEAQGASDTAAGLADQKRQFAQDSLQQAQGYTQQARNHLDDIGALAFDYAHQKIDPDRYWKEKSVPQKIATVVGAMLAGWVGGPKGAQEYVDNLVNRSIALQQQEIQQKGQGLQMSENLFHNFMKINGDEQEAYDKTRAALIDAAMTDASAAAAKLKGGVETAQMKEFMAQLKLKRDEALAALQMARMRAGTGGPGGNGWLELDSSQAGRVITGSNGQKYLIDNPQLGDDTTNILSAYDKIRNNLKMGAELLKQREKMGLWEANKPWAPTLQQGAVLNGNMADAMAKLANARGVPSTVMKLLSEQVPNFGDRLATLSAPKIDMMIRDLDSYETEVLHRNGARPVEVANGGGAGKKAGVLTTYVRPSSGTPGPTQVPQTVAAQRQYKNFQPDQR